MEVGLRIAVMLYQDMYVQGIENATDKIASIYYMRKQYQYAASSRTSKYRPERERLLRFEPDAFHYHQAHKRLHQKGRNDHFCTKRGKTISFSTNMPPPALTETQRHFFSLYRRLLRVHEKKLPFEMRVLGNLFVKFVLLLILNNRQEFKKTVNAKQQFMNRFLYEWEAYYDDLAHDKHVIIFVAVVMSRLEKICQKKKRTC